MKKFLFMFFTAFLAFSIFHNGNTAKANQSEDSYTDSVVSDSEIEPIKGTNGEGAFELGFIISHGLLNSPVSEWHKGSLDFPAMSLVSHYKKHGKEVKASSAADYLNKAIEYRRTAKKGVKPSNVSGVVAGVKRYKKNGKYIDLAPDNRIISFGTQ